MLTEKYNYPALSRQEHNGARHYVVPTGHKLPSVTTILSQTATPEQVAALQNWRRAMGPQRAQQITTEAANRGTRMHKYLEDYVLTGQLREPGTNPYSRQSQAMARSIVDQGLGDVNEFWATEVPLYHSELYAGTTDCVGVWRGQPAVLDFKQSNKVKTRERVHDYFLQLAAYMLAHDYMHQTRMSAGVILMSVAPPTPLTLRSFCVLCWKVLN
jgi:ATP-dependent exoDNAse (exonuclease V) beta subunit